MREEQTQSASMHANYGDQVSELASRLDAAVGGQAATLEGARPIEIQVAPISLGDAVPEALQSADVAAAVPDAPSEQGSEDDALLPKETLAQVERAANRNLSNKQIIALCLPFVDSTKARPTFISTPILGKVYVGVYPLYGEILTAENMLGSAKDETNVGMQIEYKLLAELSSVIRGFVFASDPGLPMISLYPYDYTKWPKLHPTQFLNSLHPSTREVVFPQLAAQYIAWKVSVTPTNAEMEKYYGLIG